jgi:hypothetical protein
MAEKSTPIRPIPAFQRAAREQDVGSTRQVVAHARLSWHTSKCFRAGVYSQ